MCYRFHTNVRRRDTRKDASLFSRYVKTPCIVSDFIANAVHMGMRLGLYVFYNLLSKKNAGHKATHPIGCRRLHVGI